MAICVIVIYMVFHEDICLFDMRKEQRFYGHGFVSTQQINYFLQIGILVQHIALIYILACHFP
jgi:hypothetical protein